MRSAAKSCLAGAKGDAFMVNKYLARLLMSVGKLYSPIVRGGLAVERLRRLLMLHGSCLIIHRSANAGASFKFAVLTLASDRCQA